MKVVNPASPSTPSTSSNILSTSAKSSRKENHATIDDLAIFIDIPVKDDTANHHSTTPQHAKENNVTTLTHPKKIMLLRIMTS